MVLAEVDWSLGDAFLTLLSIFLFIIWFWILIGIFGDLFGDREVSGWGKAAWTIFLIVAPFLGILVYLIVRGHGMADRSLARQQAAQKQFDAYVKQAAGTSGGGDATEQIAKAKALLDQGAIDQAEFDALKKKALAG